MNFWPVDSAAPQSKGVAPRGRRARAALLSLLLICWLAGCNRGPHRTDEEKNASALAAILVGTWLPPELDGETMTFESGGRWTAGHYGGPQSRGSWKIEGGRLVISWEMMRGQAVPASQPPHAYEIVSVEKDSFHAKTTEGDPAEWKKVSRR